MKTLWMKKLRYALVTGVIFSSMVAMIAWSVLGPTAQFRNLVFTWLVSFIPGMTFGAALSTAYDLYVKLDTRVSEAERLFREVRVTWSLQKLTQSIMDDYSENHHGIVERLIDTSVDRINQIPSVNPVEFYNWLIRALESCGTWQGIHQGSISLLGRNTEEGLDPTQYHLNQDGHQPREEWYKILSKMYFDKLCEATTRNGGKVEATRIIILPAKHQKDLQNPQVMESFWHATGKRVRSYWTPESAIEHAFPTVFKLEDAALHDKELFLQYNRVSGVVQFLSLKSKVIPSNPQYINTAQGLVQFLFWDLDRHLKSKELSQFQYVEITRDYIKQMTGKDVGE